MSRPALWTLYGLKIGVLIVAITVYFTVPAIHDFIVRGIQILSERNFHQLKDLILSYGVWAPITAISLMAVQSLFPFVPGLAITITNAWIFGWLWGSLYSWIGSLIGAAIDFGIARWYGRPVLGRFVNVAYLDKLNVFFETHGLIAIALARLTPVIPYKLVSYGAGFTKLSSGTYLLATAVGQTPAILLYSFLGQNINHSLQATILITSLFVLFFAVAYYYRESIEKYFFQKNQ
jgi:uncharacterized membrane protein YdjX (TVP38/TMEM64 family)